MSLLKCVECGEMVSSFASACPHCGCPNELQTKTMPTEKNDGSQETSEEWDEVARMVATENTKLSAIRRVCNLTGASTYESKRIVDYIQANHRMPPDLPNVKLTVFEEQADSNTFQVNTCRSCNRQISVKAETCPHCGHPTGVHVCPKCQSINTTVISGASKATSVFLWGPFAANKVVSKFQCKDCGHKW